MHTNKAKNIRLLVLDVDGVLTCGNVAYSDDGEIRKSFNLRDGFGIKLMQKANIAVAIITGKNSNAVKFRANELGIEHVYLGQEDKVPAYEELKIKFNVTDEQVAYMGDDLPDAPLLKRAGLSATVPDAPDYIKQNVDIVTTRQGGSGAVRELCEHILHAQGHLNRLLEQYFTR